MNYDRLSRWYELLAGSEEPSRQAALELLAARPGERMLEIGPGTGRSLSALGRAVTPGGLTTGLELSAGMLRQARAHTAGQRRAVELHCGDGLSLPYPALCYDGILMTFVLELFTAPEIPQVLDGCRRVLRSGGRLAVAALEKTPGRATAIYEWFHRRFPELVDCRPIDPSREMQSAGFEITSTRRLKMWGLAVCILRGEKPC